MKMKQFKHCLFAVAIAILFVCCFSITASADVWDGQGSPVGGNASAVRGVYY